MDIQPDKQNINQTFANTRYHIDFYQRDYKWTEEPVRRLLDDVSHQFEETYQKHLDLEPNKENVNARYPWYYLNTYVTNTVGGKVFVVDGQQRLTTLTLILLKLRHLAEQHGSKTGKWLEAKIAGYDGADHEFWMNHVRHKQVLNGLFEGVAPEKINTDTGVTAVNMVRNYVTISAELDGRLGTQHKLDTFVHYFLQRLVLINLAVESTQVPMVFEVINDRGVKLKPYEILKGKLLGQIDKLELESGQFNELWEKQLRAIDSLREEEVDSFFRHWLKAKYAHSRKDGQRFDGDYHREMFKADMNTLLGLDHNPTKVKSFLKGDFRYYTDLYQRLLRATMVEVSAFPAVFFNSLNELDSQFMLVLSACTVDDPEEEEKIRLVSAGIDRLFSLLQLQGVYDSNEFAGRLFDISNDIRARPACEIAAAFSKHLLLEIEERRATPATQTFSWPLFSSMSIDRLNTRFTRYLFGRVELLLAEGMRLAPKHALKELVTSRGARTGFHVEHILSRNAENLALFAGDEERFEQQRNLLGGILLLKGRDNISSNNEVYAEKLKSYGNSLYWNETLRQDTYQSKLDFREFTGTHKLAFRPLDQFGPKELEERQRLLYDMLHLIWAS
ncbi:DUF262 domain-containing protein [Acidovorax sp.]|uniref:DUF262 domain-containing protein n=1 Tax=Acidovorax sp. TaxID=1872122 RepID=UPI003CFFC947